MLQLHLVPEIFECDDLGFVTLRFGNVLRRERPAKREEKASTTDHFSSSLGHIISLENATKESVRCHLHFEIVSLKQPGPANLSVAEVRRLREN